MRGRSTDKNCFQTVSSACTAVTLQSPRTSGSAHTAKYALLQFERLTPGFPNQWPRFITQVSRTTVPHVDDGGAMVLQNDVVWSCGGTAATDRLSPLRGSRLCGSGGRSGTGGCTSTPPVQNRQTNKEVRDVSWRSSASTGWRCGAVETDLPALQPHILELVVHRPVPTQTGEEASETEKNTRSFAFHKVEERRRGRRSGHTYPCTGS